ncbi:hypothetical protein LguiB_027716 [Lonicera macranthoides]
MIASEQSKRDKHKRVSGYIFPLANLIKSPKDVVLLSNYGIIQHEFNDDDQVRRLFHNVANEVVIDVSKCYFWGLYMEMHAYSKNNWHQWKGSWFKWKLEVDLKMQRQQKLSEKPSTQSRSKCSLRKYTQNHVEAKEKRKLSPNNFDVVTFIYFSSCRRDFYAFDKLHSCSHAGLLPVRKTMGHDNWSVHILLGDFAQPPPSAAYAAATTTENPSVGLAIAWSTLETHFLH